MAQQTFSLNRSSVLHEAAWRQNAPFDAVIPALKANASDPRFFYVIAFGSNGAGRLNFVTTNNATSDSEPPNERLSAKFNMRGNVSFTMRSGTSVYAFNVDLVTPAVGAWDYTFTAPAGAWQWAQNNSGGTATLTISDVGNVNLSARASTIPATARASLWRPEIGILTGTEPATASASLRDGIVLGANVFASPAFATADLQEGQSRYSTLAELRNELAENVGYESDPDAANKSYLNSVLKRSQVFLYSKLTSWFEQVQDYSIPTEVGKWQYAWPTTLDPEKVEYVYARRSAEDVIMLYEGFSVETYDLRESYMSWPTRYRRRASLEIWPTPDDVYTLIVGAMRKLARFDRDSDRASIPDDIILAQAIILVWQRQGRGVPPMERDIVQQRVRQLRARSHEQYYLPGNIYTPPPYPRVTNPGAL